MLKLKLSWCLAATVGLLSSLGTAFATTGTASVPGLSCRTTDAGGNSVTDHFYYTEITASSSSVWLECPLPVQDSATIPNGNIVGVTVLGNSVGMACYEIVTTGPTAGAQGTGFSTATYPAYGTYQNAAGNWVYYWQNAHNATNIYVACYGSGGGIYYVNFSHL